jgi:histidinol-phosphate aminotransferase
MTGPAPRPGIMDITPYVGGESGLAAHKKPVRLASNEGALGPSPKAIEAYNAVAGDLHRYPDGGGTALREALADHYGLDAIRIVLGAGSDEIISLLCRAYAGPGDEVVHSEHGFLMYTIAARGAGATPVAAAELELTADVDALLARVNERTRILFLANPNNPTGSYLSVDSLARLRDGLPPSVLLVVDAAYAEYVTRNDYSAGVDLVESSDNVVMARTFSKIFGLGGVRLGWAYCPPAVADVLNRARNPFNVSAPAQAAGLAALADVDFTDRARANNDTWLPWTTAALQELGYEVAPSIGNFVLVRFGEAAGADAADAFLRDHGIIVRRMGAYGLPNALRVTIGLEDEMRAVVDALAAFKD